MYDKELEFAKTLAFKAGELMRKNFSLQVKKEWKNNDTPLTETDVAINTLTIEQIKKQYPSYGIVTEEADAIQNKAEFVWVCDPIDGTFPFSHGIPTSVYSLALCKDGKPVVGVAYDPFQDRLYTAVENGETLLNGKRIQVNDKKLSVGATALFIPHWLEASLDSINDGFLEKQVMLMSVESFVYCANLIASGEIVAAIVGGAYPWDRAAAKLIVERAGGMFTDENGKEATVFGKPKMVVMSNGIVHKEVLSILRLAISAFDRKQMKR